MNQQVDQVLRQLAATFTVRDIMVEADALVRASSIADAKQLLIQHPRFDVIPLPATGPLVAYLHRDRQEARAISSADLISDGTSLLDIPYLMNKRTFFFILSSNSISGFVHFSDLNKSLVKLPFFVLFEALESHIWPLVFSRLDEADFHEVLDPQRVNRLMEQKARDQKKNVDVGWSGRFSLDEILKFAMYYEIIGITQTDREVLVNVRNRVAHSDKVLVGAHGDTRKLVKSYELCQSIFRFNPII
jgi:hypothetical protein